MSTNPAQQDAAKVLELFPHIGATALFKKHVRGEGALAATDGTHIFLSQRYFELDRKKRRGILIHEYLHCVMSHPERAALLLLREGSAFDMRRLNVAADALINETIRIEIGRRPRHLDLPDNLYYLKEVAAELYNLGVVKSKDEISLAATSMEALYFLLGEALDKAKDILSRGESQAQPTSTADRAAQSAARKIVDWCEEDPDLKPAEGTPEQLRGQIEKQKQINANASSTYGSEAGSLVDRLKGDIPKSRTPWERVLRHLGAKHLSKTRSRNPRRPSNGMLSREGMGGADIWQPGRIRSPQPRALVIADSSGSIDLSIYARFLGELDRMRKRTNASFDFATADTSIKPRTKVDELTDLKSLKFEGRAGTSFIEPLSVAEKEAYDLVIYMTDLAGSFPKACKVPVIWAAPLADAEKRSAPFGRLLAI